MEIITVSPKYQIVIPKNIRKGLKLKPGQKLQVMQVDDRIEYIPLGDIKKARGFLKGMDTEILREEDRI